MMSSVSSCFRDVAAAAFAADGGHADPGEDRCARCAATSVTVSPASAAVSRTFTGFDSWKCPAERGLCAPCVWAYRTPAWRRDIHRVTTDPGVDRLSPVKLGQILSAPLSVEVAVIVPLRPGRKHVLPHARWGEVAVDDVSLPWRSSDVALFAAVRRLRSAGFGVRDLREPSPPFQRMQTIAGRRWPAVLSDWEILAPMRPMSVWWELAMRASTPKQSGGAR